MKGLETGKDKVKRICDILKKETLEPAQMEAQEILEEAKRERDALLSKAKEQADQLLMYTKQEIERQKGIFEASLAQACRQTIEALKEKIEKKLFSPELAHLVIKPMQDKQVIAKLIAAVIGAIEKEGIDVNLSAYIPSAVPAEEVNALLASHILDRLKEKGVLVSTIGGGIEVKLVEKGLILDLSDHALKELLAGYIRKDFRELIFAG